MAIKTFTTGEVLTAADTNTYLANSGLVYVAGGSFAAAANVDITGFSTTYEYYRLELKVKQTAGGSNISAQLYNGATVRNTGYYGSSFFSMYNGTSGVLTANNNTASATFTTADSVNNLWCGDIRGLTSDYAVCNYQYYEATNTRAISGTWFHAVSETNDKIRLTPGSSTISGNWRLYGYREP